MPDATNGRGIAEAGFLPGYGPGYVAGPAGRDAAGIADALRGGDLTALYLLHTDPLRDTDDAPGWDAALEKASYVVAHAQFLTEGVREHANVVFPAESHAEKEGTVTHPDGRVQRLRPAIGRQDQIRPEWQVLSDLAGSRRPRPRRPDRSDGDHAARRGRPVLRGHHARRARRHGLALAGHRPGRPGVPGARDGHLDRGRRRSCPLPRPPTAPCASGRSARSGPRPRSRSRRH